MRRLRKKVSSAIILPPNQPCKGRVEFIVCGCIHLTDCNAKSAGGLLGFDFSRKDGGPSLRTRPTLDQRRTFDLLGSRSSGRSY